MEWKQTEGCTVTLLVALSSRQTRSVIIHASLNLFSPLGKLAGRAIKILACINLARSAKVAERAICFTDRNFYLFFFFFNDFSETNYLKIRWTDFRNLYVE